MILYQVKPHSFVIDAIEKHAILQSPNRLEELVKIFIHATNVSFPLSPEPINCVTDSLEDGNRLLEYGRKAGIIYI